jgi:hypothetical protein
LPCCSGWLAPGWGSAVQLPPASLYLGDGGALVFGFLLATLSIRGATGEANEVFIGVPLLALGFPVLDTLLSAARRLLDRRSPFVGDQDHIHHRLEALSLGPRISLAFLYALSGAFGAAAAAAHYVDSLAAEVAIVLGFRGNRLSWAGLATRDAMEQRPRDVLASATLIRPTLCRRIMSLPLVPTERGFPPRRRRRNRIALAPRLWLGYVQGQFGSLGTALCTTHKPTF